MTRSACNTCAPLTTPQLRRSRDMAVTSVSDFSFFINRQIEVQERIEECLWQLKALMTVAVMVEGFHELSENILHNYFSIADDLIGEAAKANQISLSELLKQKPLES